MIIENFLICNIFDDIRFIDVDETIIRDKIMELNTHIEVFGTKHKNVNTHYYELHLSSAEYAMNHFRYDDGKIYCNIRLFNKDLYSKHKEMEFILRCKVDEDLIEFYGFDYIIQ